MQGFGCKELLYSDYSQLPPTMEEQLRATYVSLEDLVKRVPSAARSLRRVAFFLCSLSCDQSPWLQACAGCEALPVHVRAPLLGIQSGAQPVQY